LPESVDATDADGDGLGVGRLSVGRWSVWEAETSDGFPVRRRTGSRRLQRAGRFVSTSGGVRLLVVSGSGVRLYRAVETGYELAGQADGSGRALKLPGEVADIDGDGAPEAIFADETGVMVVFRIGAEVIERVAVQSLAHAMSGKFMAISGTTPAELLAVSVESSGADADLEIARASVRVTRLAWTGSGFEEVNALSFAGLSAERDLQFMDLAPGVVLLRRGPRLDAIFSPHGALVWGGSLESSQLARVEGAVRYGPVYYTLLWLGGSGADPGELLHLSGRLSYSSGLRPPRVASASLIPEGLRLVVAWEDEGCNPSTLLVGQDEAPPRIVSSGGLSAVDTLSMGVTVDYALQSNDCTWPTLTVTALEPSPPPTLEWDGPVRILASFARPLGAPPQNVRLRGEAGDIVPSAVQLDRTGARLVVSFPADTLPDSLFITGAVDTAGLPVGGAWTWRCRCRPRRRRRFLRTLSTSLGRFRGSSSMCGLLSTTAATRRSLWNRAGCSRGSSPTSCIHPASSWLWTSRCAPAPTR
jgi:hypothetical protein